MPEILVFKAGKYPQGEWSKERTQKLAESYDPEKDIEAPVIIGHRGWADDSVEGQFAHGWVKSLRMDGAGKVWADIPEFSVEVKRALAEKKLRYVSVEIFERDKRDAAQPPYLRAVALLGRDTPAVAGTRLPTLFEWMGGGSLSVDGERGVAVFTRRAGADEFAPFAARNEEEDMGKIEELEAELAKKDAEIAAFKQQADAARLSGLKADAEAHFARLRDEGKLPPALFERAVALDARLDGEARQEFRDLLAAGEAKIDLSGRHAADKNRAAPAKGGDGLSAKVKAFQTEKKIATFAEAAAALYAEKPELFDEEGVK
jgi:hypothetical protein